MRTGGWLALATLVTAASGCQRAASQAGSPPAVVPAARAAAEVVGKTQPARGRSSTIAPVVLHAAVEVLVAPGDRVKKYQPLVKLDDDEAQADVRAKKAALAELQASLAKLKAQPRAEERAEARAGLESARVSATEARRVLARLEALWQAGALSLARYHEASAAALKAAADERASKARLERLLRQPVELEVAEVQARVAAAQAVLEVAQAELSHYTVTAATDGVVSWLKVNPGTVSRPGTAVWGEIVDLREVEVHCALPPRQAERVAVGQAAEVSLNCDAAARWPGRVAFVGVAADQRSGKVPVVIRVANPQERLRYNVEVTVRFGDVAVPVRGP
jgi:membrane fusion protein (multidrug efflux system)